MYKLSDFDKSSRHLYKLGKILSTIICIIILFLIIFNVTLMVESYINPNELPSFLGIKSFVIVSESMEPTIMTEDVIFITNTSRENLEVGDIISFRIGDYINTHRIIRIEQQNGEEVYITKGDNNNAEDRTPVKFEDIEGKYLFRLPGFGRITDILKSKVTLVILLVFLVIISYYEVRISRRKLKRKEERFEFNKKLVDQVKSDKNNKE